MNRIQHSDYRSSWWGKDLHERQEVRGASSFRQYVERFSNRGPSINLFPGETHYPDYSNARHDR